MGVDHRCGGLSDCLEPSQVTMSMTVERRYSELRQEGGRRLSGVLIRYGDIGIPPWGGRERFESGAFGNLAGADIVLNSFHERSAPLARTGGGGLELFDTDNELTIRAELPDTTDANDTLEMVRAGILRGLSVEFKAISERTEDQDLRVVETASLRGCAVVDAPAYPDSSLVQARRRGGSYLRAKVPYRRPLDCRCHNGACDRVQFEPEAFSETLADPENEVLAIVGEYSGAIASRRRGSLILKSTG